MLDLSLPGPDAVDRGRGPGLRPEFSGVAAVDSQQHVEDVDEPVRDSSERLNLRRPFTDATDRVAVRLGREELREVVVVELCLDVQAVAGEPVEDVEEL